MKQKNRRFCPYCGMKISRRQEDDTWRDFCTTCNLFFYENPLPVVSSILVSDRSILLVKRGKKPYRGAWCLPTGFAETGERIEEAALRELEEESGIKGRILNLVDVDSCVNYFYGDLLFLTFEAELLSGRPLAGGDAVEAKFFPIDKVPRLAFSSNTRAVKAFSISKADQWAIADSFALTVGAGQRAPGKKNLLSDRLVRIVEQKSDQIVTLWIRDVTTSQATAGYRQLSQSWMFKGVQRILSHFGKWLGGFHSDAELRDFYVRLGKGSRREGLQLTEVLTAMTLLRRRTWEYAVAGGIFKKTIDIYAALELGQRIITFFDKAALFAAKGFEER